MTIKSREEKTEGVCLCVSVRVHARTCTRTHTGGYCIAACECVGTRRGGGGGLEERQKRGENA